MKFLSLALIPILLAPLPVRAQGGGIAGTVTDSAGAPLADADVFLRGAGRRTRADSAGRYRFGELQPASYTLIARKIGYEFEDADVFVRAGATVKQDFSLKRRVVLPGVEVTAKFECPLGQTIRGFFCRQMRFTGQYLDYPEIDFQNVTYTAELFQHIRGFRVGTRRTMEGLMEPAPIHIGGRCVRYIVDGRVMGGWVSVPVATKDITAMEVYVRPDSIPPEVRKEMLFGGANSRACDAVVIWTKRAGG